MGLKFAGNFDDLQQKLASLGGSWDDSQPNKKILRLEYGVMNWFETTGSINFQGKGTGKDKLESSVPSLLYPTEIKSIQPATLEPLTNTTETENEASNSSTSLSLERQYLSSGVNDGELIIGIVSAVGTETGRVLGPLKDRLGGFGYKVEEVRVSSILPTSGSQSSEYNRIKKLMSAGDELRKSSKNNAILAAGGH